MPWGCVAMDSESVLSVSTPGQALVNTARGALSEQLIHPLRLLQPFVQVSLFIGGRDLGIGSASRALCSDRLVVSA